MYYTYILKSVKDGKRYIGSTNSVLVRLDFHNKGSCHATKNRRPFELVCFQEFNSRAEAMRYEKYLKRLKGGKQLYIEMLKMLK